MEKSDGEQTPVFSEHAPQLLATEHWGLLSARSLLYAEAFSRVTVFLAVLSAAVVAMALVVNTAGVEDEFTWAGLLLAPLVLFLGITTYVRLVQINLEDVLSVVAMNRIRHAYVEMAPELARYFSTGWHDDQKGVFKTLLIARTKMPRAGLHFFVTTPTVVALIDAFVAGATVVLVVANAGGSATAALGSGVAAFVGVAIGLLAKQFQTIGELQKLKARFPTEPGDYPDELPADFRGF